MSHEIQQQDERVRWPRWAKWGVSLLLLGHLFAVFIAPFTFATITGPTPADGSPAAIFAMRKMRPYVDLMYLNHGYFFFAPEPGPSHLMRFATADGEQTLTFPDRKRQWPRLLYHRHFMLSEWLHNSAPPLEIEAAIRRERPQSLANYDRLRQAYLNHVKSEFGLADVRLIRVEHFIPSPDVYFRERLRLTDESLYRNLEVRDASRELVPEQISAEQVSEVRQ